ncbi:MAG: PilZ domain-containing protein [Myxococcaceae bacterium]
MNKRTLPRLRKRLKLTLGGRLPAFTSDVSPFGFSAEVMRTVRPGTTVHGSITLGDTEFPFTGTVRWSKAAEPRLQSRGRFGVTFTGIANAFYELFARTFPTTA